jgi:hypothetical protein
MEFRMVVQELTIRQVIVNHHRLRHPSLSALFTTWISTRQRQVLNIEEEVVLVVAQLRAHVGNAKVIAILMMTAILV